MCKISLEKRKNNFLKTNSKSIGKPKDLWKAIKSLGLPSKSGRCIVGALTENQIVKHDTKSILKTFKTFLFKPGRKFIGKTSKVAKSIHN